MSGKWKKDRNGKGETSVDEWFVELIEGNKGHMTNLSKVAHFECLKQTIICSEIRDSVA